MPEEFKEVYSWVVDVAVRIPLELSASHSGMTRLESTSAPSPVNVHSRRQKVMAQVLGSLPLTERSGLKCGFMA